MTVLLMVEKFLEKNSIELESERSHGWDGIIITILHSSNCVVYSWPIYVPSINFPLNITRCSSLKFVNSSADEKLISRDTAFDLRIFFGTRASYKRTVIT